MLHFQDGIQRHLGRKRQIFYFSAGNNSQPPNPFPPKARRSLSLFSRRARIKRVGENGSGPEARRDPAAQAGPSRWNLVAIRRWRNPLLIFASRKSTKTKNKSAVRRRRNFSGKSNHSVGLPFLFVLVETRAEHRVSKGGFRHLRTAASLRGWTAPGNSSPGPRLSAAAGIPFLLQRRRRDLLKSSRVLRRGAFNLFDNHQTVLSPLRHGHGVIDHTL